MCLMGISCIQSFQLHLSKYLGSKQFNQMNLQVNNNLFKLSSLMDQVLIDLEGNNSLRCTFPLVMNLESQHNNILEYIKYNQMRFSFLGSY